MDTKVNNKELKDCLEILTKKTFDFYNRALSQYPASDDPVPNIFVINQLENEVKNLDEYKSCIEIGNADTNIKSLMGKMVGTLASGMSRVESIDICILQFINQLYLYSKDRIFKIDLFNERYEAFEELFYSTTMRFVDTVRLHNFESGVDEIILEEGLVIKKLPHSVDAQTQLQERRYKPYTQFSKSDFVIERRYTKLNMVGGFTSEPDPEQVNKELNESGDVFDLVIKSLRILKSSAIYRGNAITTEIITFSTFAGIASRSLFFENTVLGNKCVLSAQEIHELKKLFEKLKQVKNQSLKIASNRLGFGMERRLDEDKLLDYMIGLESLYLPDGNDELTFRLSLRVAFIINQETAKRKKTFKFMKKMYRLRSKIAHGKENELTKEDISTIEDILRNSLKIYLGNPDSFTTDTYNKRGELVKEGILDNIFFSE
jgi:hypothetical protein